MPLSPITSILRRGFLLAAILLGAAGCVRVKPGMPPGLEGVVVPPPLAPLQEKLFKEGQRNWVLNLNELAVAALREGDRDLARRCLDESILEINAVFGSTAEATAARTLFFGEDVKLFKGDPYERSMTFLYRGVLYMQDGDWENARACMRSAILQDAFAEEEQNAADWATLDYLLAVCELRLGNSLYAREALDRAANSYAAVQPTYQKLASGPLSLSSAMPPLDSDLNLLVIGQWGPAPQKVRTGRHGQFLAYRRAVRATPYGEVQVGPGGGLPVIFTDSLYYQATTRGGRAFDRIAGKKVFFKDASKAVGDVAMVAGIGALDIASNSRSNRDGEAAAIAGVILLLIAGVTYLFSSLITPEADIRQWTSLPDAVGIAAIEAPAGPQDVRIATGAEAMLETRIAIPKPGTGMAVVLTFPGPRPFVVVPPAKPSPGGSP